VPWPLDERPWTAATSGRYRVEVLIATTYGTPKLLMLSDIGREVCAACGHRHPCSVPSRSWPRTVHFQRARIVATSNHAIKGASLLRHLCFIETLPRPVSAQSSASSPHIVGPVSVRSLVAMNELQPIARFGERNHTCRAKPVVVSSVLRVRFSRIAKQHGHRRFALSRGNSRVCRGA